MIYHHEPGDIMATKEFLAKETIHNIQQLSGFPVILNVFFL